MPSVRLLDCALATFSYTALQFNPVAAATDVWSLEVPALATVKVRSILLGGTAAAIRTQPVSLIRRSTKTTGGTNTTPTIAKADTSDQVPAAVLRQWTTLPGALGTAVATVDGGTLALVTSGLVQDRLLFNYSESTLKPIFLGGAVADNLSINFTGVATIATDKLDFAIWWTEG